MDNSFDTMVREALERRNRRVLELPPGFMDRVMEQIEPLADTPKPLADSPHGRGGRGSHHWWLMVPSIGAAAAVVVGLFLGTHGSKDRAKAPAGYHEPAVTAPSPILPSVALAPQVLTPNLRLPRGEGVYTAPASLPQEAKVSQLPAPIRGGGRGGVGRGTTPASSAAQLHIYPTPAPPLKGAGIWVTFFPYYDDALKFSF